MLTVDQIEAYCASNKIDISTLAQDKRTKAGFIKFLDDTGHIKK